MSNIIKTENLKPLYLHLEYLRSNGINKTFIDNFLSDFTIRDETGKPLVSYSLDWTKSSKPNYSTSNNSVNIPYEGFLTVIAKYYDYLLRSFDSYHNITDDLKNYLAIYVLLHELEHSYQACISKGSVITPSILLESCYKLFFKSKDEFTTFSLEEKARYIIQELIYRVRNKGLLVLERNANIESLDLIYKLASLESNEDLIKLFEELRMFTALIGYNHNGPGVIVYTAKSLLQYDKLRGFEEIETFSFEEKIRYGMPISDEELYNLAKIILESEDGKYLTLKKRLTVK